MVGEHQMALPTVYQFVCLITDIKQLTRYAFYPPRAPYYMFYTSSMRRWCRRFKLRLWLLTICAVAIGYVLLDRARLQWKRDEVIRFRLERFIAAQNRPPREGPGERGKGVVLTAEEQKIADTLFTNASFNVFASEKIAMDRSIPDTRRRE